MILEPSQVQLTATLDESGFQNLVLRGDRAAFKDMGEAVRQSIARPDVLGERFGLTIGGGDHLAKDALLKKTDLAELLVAHLFIRHTLELFWPRLVDDMGNLLFCELATELVFPTLHGHVALLRTFRESLNQFRIHTLDFKRRAGAPGDITNLVQTLGEFVAIDYRAVVDGPEHIARLQCLPTPFLLVPGCIEQDEVRV